MNINNFCMACESLHNESTQIFWHGTSIIFDGDLQSGFLSPRSLDLGNAFNKPGLSLFLWKTQQEAVNWSLFTLLTNFQFWLMYRYVSDKKQDSMYDYIFEKDSMLKEYEKYVIDLFWDYNKGTIIIPNRDKYKLYNIIKYFEKHETYCYQIKVETRTRYVSIGQTSTLKEYTTRDPMTKIITLVCRAVGKDLINSVCEVVPDNFYNNRNAIGDAGLLNRGILSFFNTNDFEINRRTRCEDIRKLKTACGNGEFKTSEDVIKYIKANNIKIEKIYPMERLVRAYNGRKYLNRLTSEVINNER